MCVASSEIRPIVCQRLQAPNRVQRRIDAKTPRETKCLCFFSERLSIAYITNPWAPVKWITAPHRVTIDEIMSNENVT